MLQAPFSHFSSKVVSGPYFSLIRGMFLLRSGLRFSFRALEVTESRVRKRSFSLTKTRKKQLLSSHIITRKKYIPISVKNIISVVVKPLLRRHPQNKGSNADQGCLKRLEILSCMVTSQDCRTIWQQTI